jgi:hypothetical protein
MVSLLSAKLLRYLLTMQFMYSALIESLGCNSSSMASGLMYFLIPSRSLLASLMSSMNWGLGQRIAPHFKEFRQKSHFRGVIGCRLAIMAVLARLARLGNDQVRIVEVAVIAVNLSWLLSGTVTEFQRV